MYPCSQLIAFAVSAEVLRIQSKLIRKEVDGFPFQGRCPKKGFPHGISSIMSPDSNGVPMGTTIHHARNNEVLVGNRVNPLDIHIPKESATQLMNQIDGFHGSNVPKADLACKPALTA